MKTSWDIYDIHVSEEDVSGARWMALQIRHSYLVYAEYGRGIFTFIDYATLDSQNIYLRARIDYITNETQSKPESYIYLRSLNVLYGRVALPVGHFNLSDSSHSLSQNCKIYSNGASDVYFVP
jgi:uncharacterized membrane protein